MKSVLHKSETRGHANHGWLDSHHTFSFAGYHDPERMYFGVLRVLNDDIVQGGMGFGTHPHDNMEIISIPLKGELEHKDSMGNTHVIYENDIQAMSAGTGIYHSEYNRNKEVLTNFLQIWIFPNKTNVEPRYDQKSYDPQTLKNNFQQILSPNPEDAGVWIHQDVWFHRGTFEPGKSTTYSLKKPGNGIYFFILEGSVEIEGQPLNKRDGYGVWEVENINIKASTNSDILVMEVPMELN
ncbi:MAG: pirin family protein [Cyclobacteriaceae bacterium]|nr:pirin family protein [Cyclobacteriaceae bacterium]